jgi:hypothetical protein
MLLRIRNDQLRLRLPDQGDEGETSHAANARALLPIRDLRDLVALGCQLHGIPLVCIHGFVLPNDDGGHLFGLGSFLDLSAGTLRPGLNAIPPFLQVLHRRHLRDAVLRPHPLRVKGKEDLPAQARGRGRLADVFAPPAGLEDEKED